MSQANQLTAATAGKPQSPLARNLALGCGGLLVALCLLVVAVVGLAAVALRSSDAYDLALNTATHNPVVIAELGAPVHSGWFTTGQVTLSGSNGDATLAIPISGPRGDATVNAIARKSAGKWRLSHLQVDVAGRTAPLDLVGSKP